MISGIRTWVRVIAAGLMMIACLSAAPQTAQPKVPTGEDATSRINPEVRLRKLHVVRPDLIPYPVYYEVYC
jgi:hypothetical protein